MSDLCTIVGRCVAQQERGLHTVVEAMDDYGVLGRSYHDERITRRALIYRLNRRTREVVASIRRYSGEAPRNIVDLGTADGLMLSKLKDAFPSAECLGIEYSPELARCNSDPRITVIQGDVNSLPVDDNSQDIAVATAVLEHLPNPVLALSEAWRVLRLGGLLIVTTPDPFWERIARAVGHLRGESHHRVMGLRELSKILEEVGFIALEQTKFMLSPIGLPWEERLETIVRQLGLDCLLANQLAVCRRRDTYGESALLKHDRRQEYLL